MKNGSVFAPSDSFAQAQRCLEIIEDALFALGLSRKNIIRTRIFVTDISQWEKIGRAHGEFFKDYPPATGMYEVQSLILPKLMVEIEADAVDTSL